jgi:AraC-like DNA-binding protein
MLWSLNQSAKRVNIYIKNMVCNRCILVVKNELERIGFRPTSLTLGEVELDKEISDYEKTTINKHLQTFGFELIDDKKSRLIGQIKSLIIELVHHQNSELKVNLSDLLISRLHHDYTYLSNLFSEVEGTTIEKYFIAQKIERVKEHLVYDELSLSEIAHLMNYSSVAYLSNQFKKVTGLTPTHFKNIKDIKRKPLDEV